jgi:hypothetical protein
MWPKRLDDDEKDGVDIIDPIGRFTAVEATKKRGRKPLLRSYPTSVLALFKRFNCHSIGHPGAWRRFFESARLPPRFSVVRGEGGGAGARPRAFRLSEVQPTCRSALCAVPDVACGRPERAQARGALLNKSLWQRLAEAGRRQSTAL